MCLRTTENFPGFGGAALGLMFGVSPRVFFFLPSPVVASSTDARGDGVFELEVVVVVVQHVQRYIDLSL